MAGPRRKFRERPKKLGAKKKIRVKAQKKRLLAAGLEEAYVNKLTDNEIRAELQKIARKKGPRTKAVKKTAKKPRKKSTVKKTRKKASA